MVLVASAKNDGVGLLRSSVNEVDSLAFNLLDQRFCAESLRPVVSQRLSAVAEGNIFAAILPHLRSNILSRVGCAYDDDLLSGEFQSIFEVVGVKDSSSKLFKSLVVRHIGN